MIWNDQHEHYDSEEPVRSSERLLDLSEPDGALDIPVALGAALRLLVRSWRVMAASDPATGDESTMMANALELERVLQEWNLDR